MVYLTKAHNKIQGLEISSATKNQMSWCSKMFFMWSQTFLNVNVLIVKRCHHYHSNVHNAAAIHFSVAFTINTCAEIFKYTKDSVH